MGLSKALAFSNGLLCVVLPCSDKGPFKDMCWGLDGKEGTVKVLRSAAVVVVACGLDSLMVFLMVGET